MLMKSFTIRFSSLLLMLLFVTNCTQSTKNIPDDQPRKEALTQDSLGVVKVNTTKGERLVFVRESD